VLIISRKNGERIHIGNDIVIVVEKIRNNRVSLAIKAPENVPIVRPELKAGADDK